MVTTIIRHTCDVCGFTSTDEVAVQACEAQGVPPSTLKVGDYVGTGVHGWWKQPVLRWALTMPQRKDEHHSPVGRDLEWRPAIECDGVEVGRNWFLPIWQVVGVFVERSHSGRVKIGNHTVGVHALRVFLWTPEHANGGPDRITWTSGGHHRALRIEPALQPERTLKESVRFDTVVSILAKSPERRAEVPLL